MERSQEQAPEDQVGNACDKNDRDDLDEEEDEPAQRTAAPRSTLVGWRLKNNVPIAEFYGKGAPRVNYLADLSRDRSPAVRRQLVSTCAVWCRKMAPEDLYEHPLMPVTLTPVHFLNFLVVSLPS